MASSPAGTAVRSPTGFLALTVIGSLLAVFALAQVTWALGLIGQPDEVMYHEAVVYDQAARLVRGEPLYQSFDRPPYAVTAYTPVYYVLAGALQAAVGPGFAAGRTLSFAASLIATGLLAYLAARCAGDWRPGALAALLFLGLGIPGVFLVPWSGMYKEDLLGVALSVGAVAALAGGTSHRRIALAAALAALAFLTKQTFVAAGLASFAWLWLIDRRRALLFGLLGCSIVFIAGALLEVTSGAFLRNAVFANVNPFSVRALTDNLAMLELFQGAALFLAGSYVLRRASDLWKHADTLVVLYWLASFLPLVGLAKIGSNRNYWIELAGATAVLAALSAWSWATARLSTGYRWLTRGGLVLLALELVLLLPLLGAAVALGLHPLSAPPTDRAALDALIEEVRATPGEVLADPLDVVVLAGRPIYFEPYIFSILYGEGRWDVTPLVERICSGGVGLLVLGYPLDGKQPAYHGYPQWPAPAVAALRETMVLQRQQAGRWVYVPGVGDVSGACGSDR